MKKWLLTLLYIVPLGVQAQRVQLVVSGTPVTIQPVQTQTEVRAGWRIVDIQLKDVRARLARERITLELTPAAVQSLAFDGLDPVYGARPLKRLIQRHVVDNVANLIIAGEVREGDTVRIDVGADDRLAATRVAKGE